jgi:predicted lipoprotein with Yx(FWY)xxD motif
MITCLVAAAALMAAGCASPIASAGAAGNVLAPTAASNSSATLATAAPSPVVPTQAPTSSPTPTATPQPPYDYGSDDYGYDLQNDGSVDAEATPTMDQGSSTAGETSVGTAASSLGLILVNSEGRTLYALTMDSPGVSTCSGSCLEAWPPLLVTDTPSAREGVQAALLGVISRTDGGKQVTYNGKPVYTYAGDNAPGDLNGQGKGGVWFAVTSDGGLAR